MPRQNQAMVEGLIPKIRKRGCSSSSSASSKVYNYRFKRAILVGKSRNGLGLGLGLGLRGSRSNTPVPSWRATPLRNVVESPKQSLGGGISQPVSARKLAATLWEMNEMPSPRMTEEDLEKKKKMMMKKEKIRAGHMSSGSVSGSLPPHLCDPSHSPVSERMDRSGTGSYQKRSSTTSRRPRTTDHNVGMLDSLSSASFMELETRSRAQTPRGSVTGFGNRLKDVSNALTTSKELLKIINRIWAHADQPSSSTSLVSALHTELERARLQVNQLIQDQRSDQNEINYLLKCFAEEKASWKNKGQQAVEAAIASVANELEVERKLRRRFESLNKKLGKELSDSKASFVKAVKELESEKRAREVMEQVCDELARDIGEDRAEAEEMKRESAKVQEEIEQEREMLQLADRLREERAHVKLSEAKNHFEEKNSAIDKLRKQLEGFLGKKKTKGKRNGSLNFRNNEDTASLSIEKDNDGEVENVADCGEDSAESDLHSIELNMDNSNKSYNWAYPSNVVRESKRISVDERRARNSIAGQPRRSTPIQRSISGGVVEYVNQAANLPTSGDGLDRERLHELEKLGQRYSYLDEAQRLKAVKGLKDHLLASSGTGSCKDISSPIRQWEQPWPSRDPCGTIQEKSSIIQGSATKSRLGEGQSVRRSRR
ncbi:uncharacterized protein At5g41620 [Solanum stenotomum]|uniref:uncharacterized protein At5g41620 n=1 Tax=Solanum stenotomum TaxID=172797 RepID=UPI0020D18831|nr:uncharacterized protein At5g41620 [Solanum stenotomum]